MKTLYWVIGIFVICLGAIFALNSGGASLATPLELDKVNAEDRLRGNASSTVVLIEYADFQCPSCRSYEPILRELVGEYGNHVAFVFRHFPLTGIHMNAEFAARAVEAAGEQGEAKWWAMHDLLFEKQDEWARDADVMKNFSNYAELIGIDVAKFKTDFVSKKVKDFVRAEKSYGNQIGIQGTPTFYLNGKKIENPTSLESFRLLINQALKK